MPERFVYEGLCNEDLLKNDDFQCAKRFSEDCAGRAIFVRIFRQNFRT